MDPLQQTCINARRSGTIADWVAAATEYVKARPAAIEPRLTLAEALIRSGNLERADVHLDYIAGADPGWAVRAALLRQLVRAEQTRRAVMLAQATPELLFDPDDTIRAALARIVDLAAADRDVDVPGSATNLTIDGADEAVAFRDLDDRFADIVEVHSSTGKYFWIPVSALRAVRFRAVESVFDAIWRPCEIEVEHGPDGVVFMPTVYPPAADDDEQHRLGAHTSWYDHFGATLGQGRRCFLAGDESIDALAIASITRPRAPSA